jgi:tetratricopeptide (TPR) repeat protein
LALQRARDAIDRGIVDYDLVNAAFILGWRGADYKLATKAMEMRLKDWPATRPQGYLQLGQMYTTGQPDPAKALAAFKQALELTPEAQRQALLGQIPPALWPKLGYANAVPVMATQTSATSK